MKRHDRRVLLNCVLIGALVTAAVVVLDFYGFLTTAENWMYDQRARHFQYSAPPPTDQLVHLDIDDKALDPSGIGRWPWPRTKLAQIVDELHTAGAKAIGMDILFVDPQEPDWQKTVASDDTYRFVRIDHDANFAAAVKRAGNVILPSSFVLDLPNRNALHDAVLNELKSDIELTEREVADRIRGRFARESTQEGLLTNVFLIARGEAVYDRIKELLDQQTLTPLQLRQRLIKKRELFVSSPLSRLVDEQRERYEAIKRLVYFGAVPDKASNEYVPAQVNLPVINTLGKVMSATAFVDFTFTLSRDGVLRTQPLLLQCEGRLYPQMGLALALQYLGAKPGDLTIGPETVTIHAPNGETFALPTSRYPSEKLRQSVPTILNIPWIGTDVWQTMYDPEHIKSQQHISMNVPAELQLTRDKITINNSMADSALAVYYAYFKALRPDIPETNDPLSRVPQLQEMLKEVETKYEFYREFKPEELPEDERSFPAAMAALKRGDKDLSKFGENEQKLIAGLQAAAIVREENIRFDQQLKSALKYLHDQINGKAVLIGWTATGHQDAVPTSLHAQCPGVVAHGAIFNAIISRHFWTVAPRWITVLFTIALGWMTAVIAWKFSPLGAFLITSAFGLSYVVLNGLYFFDHLNLLVGMAAPQVAMGGVWAGCSLARIVIETQERARVTRRFSAYADEKLVSYVMEREDEMRLQGETRELTVCFSDMAGFTSLSEKLGEQIVPILNEFLTLMVPIIRSQGGYVNKFLGDGIMYFFGAPYHSDHHAEEAVETAILMQQAVVGFNQSLVARGLSEVKVRIGINTGPMIVGDAGADSRSDYTVIGDNVNLASRLESANKQLGTLILMSARSAELAGDRFLLRPIGALQVVGKTEGVMTYSLSGLVADADAKDRRLCDLTKMMVDGFRAKDFAVAIEAADAMDAEFGESTLTGLYRNLCQFYAANPPADPFDGKIVFTEK